MVRIRTLMVAVLCALVIAAVVPSTQAEAQGDDSPFDSLQLPTVEYAPGRSLDIWVPVNAAPGPYPVLIALHGGGFTDGDRSELEGLAEIAARNGIIGITMDYRLAPEHQWPAQMVDVGLVVDWVHSMAGVLNVHTDAIMLTGHSAGGTIALTAGLHPTIDVNGIIPVSAAVDLDLMAAANPETALVTAALMGDLPRAFASPVNQVSADDPPVFLMHGLLDTAVHPGNAIYMNQILSAYGVPNQVAIYYGDHNGFFEPPTSALMITDLIRAVWLFAISFG